MISLLIVNGLVHPYISVSTHYPISFDLQSGQCLVVCGENGSGKSTLLRLLAGVYESDAITVHDQATISYVGPEYAVKPDVPVYIYHRLCAAFGLRNKLHTDTLEPRYVRTLSNGQRMFMRLNAALSQQRSVWIVDEPCRYLDATSALAIKDKIRNHCALGGAAIISAHLFDEWALLDRALVVRPLYL
jgi:heme exporter protein A